MRSLDGIGRIGDGGPDTYLDKQRRSRRDPTAGYASLQPALRATVADVPAYITGQLERGHDVWTRDRDMSDPHDSHHKRTVDSHVRFFERELEWFAESGHHEHDRSSK
jgi:hypothetical protein